MNSVALGRAGAARHDGPIDTYLAGNRSTKMFVVRTAKLKQIWRRR